ncbi:MAG: cation-transporting P-type ATPase [Desulfuromonadales bacterium]|nr:cation-transporting P-type ATPase [Desulfuromonadales bacterium]MBN2793510.1 cation-transporting P-type ATPase [Desulfuromonadales bacterium]
MNNCAGIQKLSVDQVYRALDSSPRGLSSSEAQERLREIGRNSIEIPDRWRLLRSLLRQLTNFFTLLLLISALICLVAERLQPGQNMLILGWALGGVALLNAVFSFIQEYRAEKAMEALRHFLPQQTSVSRDGKVVPVPVDELVPGDLLHLAEGDRVPADARLVEASGVMVNNAPLTGESLPLALSAEAVEDREAEGNSVFAGCLVLRGSGQAVVFATGLRTEFGKIAHLSQAIRKEPSPLERQTAHMVRVLTLIAVGLGISFFSYGMVSGRSWWINLVFMMGIIVANVPEGLLPTFTLALALGSLRMARQNVLVTSLNAVESLGSVQIICADKTGTLTRNELTVSLLSGPTSVERLGAGERRRLLTLALAASPAQTAEQEKKGDPLDLAIASAFDREGYGISWRTLFFHPFDVEKKRSAGVIEENGEKLVAVKGAWENIAPLLSEETNSGVIAAAESRMRELAGQGLRVIAVAWRPLEADEDGSDQDSLERKLIPAGFIGIEDELHEEVPAAIRDCREAGIEVLMITGDHPDTARTIAVHCGILPEGVKSETDILTGDILEELSEEELKQRLKAGVKIFARTSPTQKMKIVLALKALNRVVAMTGDGVNDAPALKAADIGIAMGKSGTDVARASAQLILLDDNFASIVAGIREGRTIFLNIRKFTNYVLVSNGPEIIPYLLYILLPVPLALTVIQILSIDLGTDIIPSMALGREPPEPDVMQHPPRGHEFQLLTPGLVIHSYLFLGLLEALWSLGLFFYVLHSGGWIYGTELAGDHPLYRSATGIALATILLMQIGNLIGRRFHRRSGIDRSLFANPLLIVGILIQVLFSWALLYSAPVQKILGTGPVEWTVYLVAWLGIPLIFGADYLRKRICYGPPLSLNHFRT